MATHTVESIKHLLATNDRAIGRALLVLKARQTDDEKQSETTKYLNGRGFRPCHARMGTSMASFFEKRGFLSPKQLAYWRTEMRDGNTRIEIYARQLLEQATINAATKVPAPEKTVDDEVEALQNTYTHLKDEYANAVDSDDLALIKPIVDALREIEKRLKLPAYVISGSVYQGVEDDEHVMQRMEAEADREQTRRDEANKYAARAAMEHR